MFNYPEQAVKEATHTDDVGYLYKVNIDVNFGDPFSTRVVHVEYWDLRMNRWCQDLGKNFSYLVKLDK